VRITDDVDQSTVESQLLEPSWAYVLEMNHRGYRSKDNYSGFCILLWLTSIFPGRLEPSCYFELLTKYGHDHSELDEPSDMVL
jgi:hypothetical protein